MNKKISTLSKRNTEIIDEIADLTTTLDSLRCSKTAHNTEMSLIEHDIEVLESDFKTNLTEMIKIAKGN